jgi:hypothetical protein
MTSSGRVGALDPFDHVYLEDRVALGRVEDHDVQTGVDEQREAFLVGGARADRRGRVELLAFGKLGGKRVCLVFEEIRARKEGDETALRVHDG